MTNTKAQTFIGFAIKSGKYKCGMNSCETLKRANLIIVSSDASDGTKKQAESLAKKLGARFLQTKIKPLSDYVHKDNVKIMAVTDFNIAKAIYEQKETDFIEGIEE